MKVMRGHLFFKFNVVVYTVFIFALFIALFFTTLNWKVLAASSDYIHFQTKLVNSDDTNVSNGTYSFKYEIYDSSTGGTLLWSEEQSVSVSDGVVDVNLGSVTSFPSDLFENSDLYLQVSMDTNGNTADGYEEDFGRMMITANAFSFHSKESEALTDGTNTFEPGDFLKTKANNTWNPDQSLTYFSFKGNSVDPLLYIDPVDDRIGIGTNSPDALLHVSGGEIWEFSDGNDPRFVIGDTPTSGDYGWLQWDSTNDYFRIDTSNSPATGLKIADNTLALGDIYPDSNSLFILADGSTERLRVTDSGQVGIGTNTPQATLHIKDSYLNTGIRVETTAATDIGVILVPPNLASAGTQQGPKLSLVAHSYDTSQYSRFFSLNSVTTSNDGDGRLDFITSLTPGGVTSSTIMSLTSDRRVGIGTTHPSVALQVVGQTRSSSFSSANGTAGSPAYRFASDANTGMFLAGSDTLAFTTNATERLRIDSTGDIGIGTTTPSAKLHVNGTVRIEDTTTMYGDLFIKNSTNYPKAVDYGDGSDGAVTITSLNTVVNKYAYVTGYLSSGATTINVDSTTDFSAGDQILVIQMQSATSPGSVGTYEFTTISSISGTTVTISSGLSNSYTSGTPNTTNAEVTQIVRVPQYTDLTVSDGASITADAWNGYKGGIVIFKATGTVIFEGTGKVNVNAKGYRGGTCNGCGNNAWGQQGEGITGLGTNSLDSNYNGGGGGYGPTGYGGEPGAGGGCYTKGDDGISSYTSTGGDAVCSSTKLIMGGGAGAGGDDDSKTPLPQNVDGGGIVLISAHSITNARVFAKGENGIGTTNNIGGVTGGGAGGTINLYFTNLTEDTISVKGGSGGSDSDDQGGDGGDGIVVQHPQADTDTLLYANVADGKIGIKNETPEYTLDVLGVVRAGTYLTYSDKRLKTNIKEIKGNLSKLEDLTPVVYEFKDQKLQSKQTHLGFLAQDVQKVYPELVYKDKRGTLAVDYQGLIAPAIGAINELQKQVATIQKDMTTLSALQDGEFKPDRITTKSVKTNTINADSVTATDNIAVSSKVAGRVSITPGKTKVVVKSESLRNSSVIIVTPEVNSFDDNVDYMIVRGEYQFTIVIRNPMQSKIWFNYLILNSTDQRFDFNSDGVSCKSSNLENQSLDNKNKKESAPSQKPSQILFDKEGATSDSAPSLNTPTPSVSITNVLNLLNNK